MVNDTAVGMSEMGKNLIRRQILVSGYLCSRIGALIAIFSY